MSADGGDVESPCRPYEALLQAAPSGDAAAKQLAKLNPEACRASVVAGNARALRLELDSPTSAAVQASVLVTCALHMPGRADGLRRWLPPDNRTSLTNEGAALCIAELAEWPEGAEVFQHVREQEIYRVEPPFLIAARRSPAVRRAAGPSLFDLERNRSKGYDELREAVCVPGEPRPADVESKCQEGPKEADWGGKLEPTAWVRAGVVTAVYASAIAGAYATRDSEGGRAFPTTGGALTGALLGMIPGFLVGANSYSRSSKDDATGPVLVLGMLAGGIAGGYVTYRLTDGPGTRTGATAGTLLVPYLVGIALTLK